MSRGRNVTEAKQPGGEMSPGRKTGGETPGAKHPDPVFSHCHIAVGGENKNSSFKSFLLHK